MRTQLLKYLLLLFTFFIPSCGQQAGNSLQLASQTGSTQKKTASQKNSYSGSNYTMPQNTTADPYAQPTTQTQTPAQTQAPQCQAAQTKVGQLYNACSATLLDNDDVVPQSCLNAFNSLSYVDCGSLNSKVSNALNACGSLFKQYSAYLPASCRQAIASLGG